MKRVGYALIVAAVVTFAAVQLSGPKASMAADQGANEIMQPKTVPLKLDKELGVPAAHIGEGKLHQVDVTLVEIPPGGKLAPHKHMSEEMIFIISGKGYTEMWNGKTGKKVKYDWSENDMLSPVVNAWHQHFNPGAAPARYLSITTAPLTQNIFKNTAFLNNNDFNFNERWEKAAGLKEPRRYGNATKGPDAVRFIAGQIFPNLRNRGLGDRGEKMLGITIDPEGDMAGNELFEVEVREFTDPKSTSPEHRHLWETVYYILKGEGYATVQQEGGPERRLDWKEGDMFLVEANEYHNHRPRTLGSRFLQFKASGYFRRVGIDKYLMQNKPGTSVILK